LAPDDSRGPLRSSRAGSSPAGPGTYIHTLKLTRKGAYTVVLRAQGTRAGTPATASFRVA
jgi:hypothetical protein